MYAPLRVCCIFVLGWLSASGLAAQVPGTFTPFGTGCSAPNTQPPVLACPQPPEIGKEMLILVTNVLPNVDGVIALGDSDQRWEHSTLPINLASLGGPNCNLYVSGTCLGFCHTGNGTVPIRLVVPNDPNFIGAEFFVQFWAPDPLSNAAGFAMSNAGKFVVGG